MARIFDELEQQRDSLVSPGGEPDRPVETEDTDGA